MRVKPLVMPCVVILLMIFGCGRPHYRVKPPQTVPSKTVVVPETKDGKMRRLEGTTVDYSCNNCNILLEFFAKFDKTSKIS